MASTFTGVTNPTLVNINTRDSSWTGYTRGRDDTSSNPYYIEGIIIARNSPTMCTVETSEGIYMGRIPDEETLVSFSPGTRVVIQKGSWIVSLAGEHVAQMPGMGRSTSTGTNSPITQEQIGEAIHNVMRRNPRFLYDQMAAYMTTSGYITESQMERQLLHHFLNTPKVMDMMDRILTGYIQENLKVDVGLNQVDEAIEVSVSVKLKNREIYSSAEDIDMSSAINN
jgi:hypothetical protein